MRKKNLLLAAALGALLVSLFCVALVMADEDIGKQEQEREITLKAMPQPVQDTILLESKGHDLEELLEVTTDRGVFYEAEWIIGEDEISILMTPDGKVIDREREKADADEDGEDDDD